MLFSPGLPDTILEDIFTLARPRRQWDALDWMTGVRPVRRACGPRFLYEDVCIESPLKLMHLRESLERDTRRGREVQSFFFDVHNIRERDGARHDLEAVLRKMTSLNTFRTAYDSRDPGALRFWSERAHLFSPSLTVFRMGDAMVVSHHTPSQGA